MSLLEKAKSVKVTRAAAGKPITDDEIELYTSFLNGEVTASQVMKATGAKSAGLVGSRAVTVLRGAIASDRLKLTTSLGKKKAAAK